jgi:ankyrin repeat protein
MTSFIRIVALVLVCQHVNANDTWDNYEKFLEGVKVGTVDPNYVNSEGRSLLFMAMSPLRSTEELEFLLDRGADHSENLTGTPPIFVAVSDSCQIEKLKLLIYAGVSVDTVDPYLGDPILHYASRHEDTQCLTYLLEEGADINIRNFNNENAYFHAINKAAVDILWENGLDLFQKNNLGLDVIHFNVLINHQHDLFREVLLRNTDKEVKRIRKQEENKGRGKKDKVTREKR